MLFFLFLRSYVAEGDLELLVTLPPPSQGWDDYRATAPVLWDTWDLVQGPMHAGQAF